MQLWVVVPNVFETQTLLSHAALSYRVVLCEIVMPLAALVEIP